MDPMTVVTAALTLFAGVGIFLTACSMMSENLQALGNRRIKALFAKASESKLIGVGVGAAATAVIQSSGAASVMVIGFVNAGIMSLTQAATVIFGANIGTTVTAQMVAVGMLGNGAISASVIFAAFSGVGAFTILLAKKDKYKKLGGIIAGFGMLFVGLAMMSDSMSSFSELGSVKGFLTMFDDPFLLVLVGAMLTAVVQSSSVMTSMSLTMVLSGLITLDQGIYITMGANIGTCVTALIVGFAGTKNAKRTALIHLFFNIGGVIVFLVVGLLMRIGDVGYGDVFSMMFPSAPQMQLAMFHTVFNVVTTVLILPFTDRLVRLVIRLVPDSSSHAQNAISEN